MNLRIPARALSLALALLFAPALSAQETGSYANGGSDTCLSCHDFGSESPVHGLLDSAHGRQDSDSTPMAGRGCESCHGPSGAHSRAPTNVSPAVSFGPRWSASIADQDLACLNCHEDDVAAHWQDALHMINDVTCVTCHDVHTTQDAVLSENTQAEVCTVCHKQQVAGVHGLEGAAGRNDPACTHCHQPHDGSYPRDTALANRSAGCNSCHDITQLNATGSASAKAASYHKVMAQDDRTCLDCHGGIAHAAADSVPPFVPVASPAGSITLFPAGQSHSEWLTSEHPGSQALRQGRACQQCHRGEEARIAEAIGANLQPTTRDVAVRFDRRGDTLELQLTWSGTLEDRDIALMWGDERNRAFDTAGCFAACHSDMSGMPRNRGQQVDKYLMASRSQQRAIGRPAIIASPQALETLRAEGNFAELWRVTLNGGQNPRFESALLLDKLHWREDPVLTGEVQYQQGTWRVTLRRPIDPGSGFIAIVDRGEQTFGMALHGPDNPGGAHWISLPRSFSLLRQDAEFTAE